MVRRYRQLSHTPGAEACNEHDVNYSTASQSCFLDIEYRSFQEDIEDRARSRKRYTDKLKQVLTMRKFTAWEKYELEHTSRWRGDYLREEKQKSAASFEENAKQRYRMWVSIHSRAINALEGHFIRNGFASEHNNVRLMLLDLWLFLPQEYYQCGTHSELQQRHVEWLTERTTVARRNDINEFLDTLVTQFSEQDKGRLLDRIVLFQGDPESSAMESELLMRNMLASGAYKLLVKRLLLQTPLIFWPAVFKANVSEFYEDEIKPCVTYYSTLGDLVVHCANTRARNGYEVSILWANSLQHSSFAAISRCSRAYEYRFISVVPNVPRFKTKTSQADVNDRQDRELPVWYSIIQCSDRQVMVRPIIHSDSATVVM